MFVSMVISYYQQGIINNFLNKISHLPSLSFDNYFLNNTLCFLLLCTIYFQKQCIIFFLYMLFFLDFCTQIILKSHLSNMKKVLLLASGSGSNVENIINYFATTSHDISFEVIANKKDAGVFERAKRLQIPAHYYPKSRFENGDFAQFVKNFQPDLIVLAGFLLLFPADVVKDFPNKIINIHPALLPNYGGKGMYGHHVHEAVLANKEAFTGITIHYVNEQYDKGEIILQEKTNIENCTTADEIAQKVHELEYKFFPIVVEKLLFG